ncbi:MAG: ComEC/Rec2 family competence protein, partial [Deltaproteobacteria bacterium]
YRLTLAIDVQKAAALLSCIPVVLYAALAGLQVSCQRAMIMALVFFGSILLDREKDVWSTLSIAAFVVLAMEPMALFSAGFQLSFTAVAGILWLGIPFLSGKTAPPENHSWGERLWLRLKRGSMGLVIISLSAQLVLLPFMRGIITFWSSVPFASLLMVTPSWLETILFYSLLFCIFFVRKWRWTRFALAMVCLAFIFDAAYWVHATSFNQRLKVTFLDVGQGNAALVQFPGSQRMIIDGGGFPGSRFDVGRNVIAPFLWREKISRVDYLVLSHPQADHMKGLIFLAQTFHPKEFWYTGDSSRDAAFSQLMKVIRDQKIAVITPESVPRNRTIAGVEVQILHPPSNNKKSSVLHTKR